MFILALICFYKTGMCISDKKPKGILIAAALFLIAGISIMLNLTLVVQNDKLEKIAKKCPEYKLIENVYVIKK